MPSSSGGRRFGIATVLMVGVSVALVAIAVSGFWISEDVAQMVPTGVVSGERKLQGMVYWLTWLVCFAPFLCFGVAILWSLFRPEDRSWLVPLRWFTFIVTLRAAAERRTLSKTPEPKLLRPGDSRAPLPAPTASRRQGGAAEK